MMVAAKHQSDQSPVGTTLW